MEPTPWRRARAFSPPAIPSTTSNNSTPSRQATPNPFRFTALAGMILAAATFRLLPHPPNFSPIAALALFGDAQFADQRAAFPVPLAALLLSDLVLGLHSLVPVIYGSFAALVCPGFWVRRHRSAGRKMSAVSTCSRAGVWDNSLGGSAKPLACSVWGVGLEAWLSGRGSRLQASRRVIGARRTAIRWGAPPSSFTSGGTGSPQPTSRIDNIR